MQQTQVIQVVTQDEFVQQLGAMAGMSPVLLVWFIGLLVALTRWKRHPKVSLVTVIALSGFFLVSFIATFTYGYLIRTWQSRSGEDLDRLLKIVDLSRSAISALFWGLLLAAIFGWRQSRAARPSHVENLALMPRSSE